MNDHPDSKQKNSQKEEVFIYKDAGIQEKHGYVPGWLWLVAIVLVVWAIYYTYANWAPPPVQ